MNLTKRIRTTALAGVVALAVLIGGTAAAVVAAPAPHVRGGAAVASAPGPQYQGLQPATQFQG